MTLHTLDTLRISGPEWFIMVAPVYRMSPLSQGPPPVYYQEHVPVIMGKKKIETVCGYSCSDCEHLGAECEGCITNHGKPFWTQFVGVVTCPVYECCVHERKLPHCGRCPDLICERFTRFKDPGMSDEESEAGLIRMEKELRSRK